MSELQDATEERQATAEKTAEAATADDRQAGDQAADDRQAAYDGQAATAGEAATADDGQARDEPADQRQAAGQAADRTAVACAGVAGEVAAVVSRGVVLPWHEAYIGKVVERVAQARDRVRSRSVGAGVRRESGKRAGRAESKAQGGNGGTPLRSLRQGSPFLNHRPPRRVLDRGRVCPQSENSDTSAPARGFDGSG